MDGKRVRNKWIESKKAKINNEYVLTYLKNGEGEKHVKIGKKYIPLKGYKKQVKQIGGEGGEEDDVKKTLYDDFDKPHLGSLTSVYDLKDLLLNEEMLNVYQKYEEKVYIDINTVKKDLNEIFKYFKRSILLDEKIDYDSWIKDVGGFFTSVQKNQDLKNANSKIINILTKICNDLEKFIEKKDEKGEFAYFKKEEEIKENQDFKFKNETLFRTTVFLRSFLERYEKKTMILTEKKNLEEKKMNLEDFQTFAEEMDKWKYLNVIKINDIEQNVKESVTGDPTNPINDPESWPFYPDIDDTISIFLKILLHIHSGRIKGEGEGEGEGEVRLKNIETRLNNIEAMLNIEAGRVNRKNTRDIKPLPPRPAHPNTMGGNKKQNQQRSQTKQKIKISNKTIPQQKS